MKVVVRRKLRGSEFAPGADFRYSTRLSVVAFRRLVLPPLSEILLGGS